MTDKLCKTCRQWIKPKIICGKALSDGWGKCNLEGLMMMSGNYATSPMETSPDFGCVLWEKKEDD